MYVFEGIDIVVLRRSQGVRDVMCVVGHDKAERWCVWSVSRGERWCVWCDDVSVRRRVTQTVLPYTGYTVPAGCQRLPLIVQPHTTPRTVIS